MLVSFQLASKHPDSLIALFDNLEQSAADPSCFEVLVKADTEDPKTQDVLFREAERRRFKLRPMITPRRRGYEDLWIALNELFYLTDPDAYFVCNINDEIRIKQKRWDERLRRYVGLFSDDIFRLRTSRMKFRNYHDFWECGFAPENYAFSTKRWLDICGDWNPCFGPDSCQQYIAYYLAYANYPSIKQYNRDVPILDITWTNEGVGLNLTPAEQQRRTATNFRLWQRQVSHPMQEELYRRARRLQAHIMQAENAEACEIDFYDDRKKKMIVVRDAQDGALLDLLPYKLSRTGLLLRNLYRSAHYSYFAGGGRESRNMLPISLFEFLMHRHTSLRSIVSFLSPRRRMREIGGSFERRLAPVGQWTRTGWIGSRRSNIRQGFTRTSAVTHGMRRNIAFGLQRARHGLKARSAGPVKVIVNAPLRGARSLLGPHVRFARRQIRAVEQFSGRSRGRPAGRISLYVASVMVRVLLIPVRSLLWMTHRAYFSAIALLHRALVDLASDSAAIASSLSVRCLRSLGIDAGSPDSPYNAWWKMPTLLLLGPIYLCVYVPKIILTLAARSFRRLDSLLNGRHWQFHGRRLALAIMDRELMWFKIEEAHRHRIALSRDPWFDHGHPRDDHAAVS